MQGHEMLTCLRKAVSALQPSKRLPLRPRRWRDQRPTLERTFATSRLRCQESIHAAPEIDLSKSDSELPLMQRVRIVPRSPSYFTGHPIFTDDLLEMQTLLRKYQIYPTLPPAQAPRVSWKKLEEYQQMVGGMPVKASNYAKLVGVLRRLSQVNPNLMGDDIREAIERFKRNVQPGDNRPTAYDVDDFGRALGVGHRKTSTARAWLVEGDGKVLVNGRSLTNMFGRVHDRESAMWPLKITKRVDKYNVFALVEGGGVTGQAEALTLAIAKALLIHEPLLKPALRRAGCITRDPRKVERKKPGHLKARKMPTWVKR